MKRRITIVVVVVAALVCAVFRPWITRECRHYLHYRALDREGRLKAEFVSLATSNAPDGMLTVSASIRNSGAQAWEQGEHYFALGVFERNMTGRRVEDVKFSDGTNRVIVHKDIAPGAVWQLAATINVDRNTKLHFQMLREDVTWFGQEKIIDVREQAASP